MISKDKYIEKYFDDVERFSIEHVQDIEKFNDLLNSLMGSNKEERYRKEINSLQETIKNFESFMEKNSIVLTSFIKNNISAISESGYTPIVKKRMIEDIIYKIKTRYEAQKKKLNDERENEKEIEELHTSKNSIIDWFRLTKFAFEYSTITLFSHYIKDSSISIVRKKIVFWHDIIERNIKDILNTKYYLLSNLEYNSLEIILRLKKPIHNISDLILSNSYDPRRISEIIDNFARIYLTIIKNSDLIENTFKKILQKDKTNHGIYGILKSLLDQPIYENKPLVRNNYDKISSSITGFLLSYYTAREKIIIRTVNQIMYLLALDGKLENKKKNLTSDALLNIEKNENKQITDDIVLSKKLNDLNRILDNFLKMGPYFEERIFKAEAKNRYNELMTEIKTKPLLRIIRLVDGYIKYFLDTMLNSDDFIIDYDNVEFLNYFDIKPDILDIISKYHMRQFDLIGSKVKEMESLANIPGGTSEGLIQILTDPNLSRLASNPKVNFARTTLQKVSEHSYRAGITLHQLISLYYNHKEVIYDDQKRNYDFFINAQIKRTRNFKINRIFNKDEITLREFLEASCSVGLYISFLLNNVSLSNIIKERDSLKKKMHDNQAVLSLARDEDTGGIDFEDRDSIVNELDEIYRDKLTKLWKTDFLKDQVLPKLYNEKDEYKYDNPRFVFKFEIFGFDKFNDMYGHNNVDKLLIEISRIFINVVEMPGKNIDDVVIRYGGGNLIGYFNDISLTGVVDKVKQINKDIKLIPLEKTGIDLSSLVINFGIYEERKGSNHNKNIDIATRILNVASQDTINNIGFIKDPHYVVGARDIDNAGGSITRDLITLIY